MSGFCKHGFVKYWEIFEELTCSCCVSRKIWLHGVTLISNVFSLEVCGDMFIVVWFITLIREVRFVVT
jgi:hypothetical protein